MKNKNHGHEPTKDKMEHAGEPARTEPAPEQPEAQLAAAPAELAKAEPNPAEPARTNDGEAVSGMWQRFHLNKGAKPLVGALTVAGSAMAIAAEIGAAELLVAVVAGYAAYRMLRYGIPLPKALSEGLDLDREVTAGAI